MRSLSIVGLLAGSVGFGVLWIAGYGVLAGSETPTLADFFKDQRADAFVHHLQPHSQGSVHSALPAGLVITTKRRRLPAPGLVVIESTLANRGKQTASIGKIPPAQWTFRVHKGEGAIRYQDLTYRNDTWYGSTYWTGPDWTRVGKDWQHPGIHTPSVRRFTAPRDGRLTITGRVRKAHLDGDGVRVSIRHAGRTVWTAEIDGKDDKGREPKLTLDVRQGDAIRFVVHKRERIFCDTTWWDPVVRYAGGQRYRASDGFSTSAQGRAGWSYEMEIGPGAEKQMPGLLAISPHLGFRRETLWPGRTVELGPDDSLPIWVLSDDAGRSGVVLAVAPRRAWRLNAILTHQGSLKVTLTLADEAFRPVLAPGESVRLGDVFFGAYSGAPLSGLTTLCRAMDARSSDEALLRLRSQTAAAMRRAMEPADARLQSTLGAGEGPRLGELDMEMMVLHEWRSEDKLTGTAESYAAATARHLEKGRKLLADLRATCGDDFLRSRTEQLRRLARAAGRANLALDDRRAIYYQVRRLKREIALANPLLSFDKLLFCKRVPTSYSHEVMQYFGWRARPGGGIFILDRPGRSLRCRDILEGKLGHGCVLEPRLSYDARRVVFSFVNCGGANPVSKPADDPADKDFYHVYEVGIDGAGLKQLTSGPYDDLMPAYLPDGGIVFSSTRRRGYARCFGSQFGRRWHVYTLHRIGGDGRNLRTLSFHDTNEWFPAVSNTGRILYARWDYIDRDAVTHQNLWAMRPDGTNPTTVWGNATSSPHCTFQIKPIPGSHKIVFTASAHHSIAGGSIAMVDPTVGYDGHEALTRITPEVPFPEAEGRDIREYYTAPWPLSEKYFLVGYSPVPLAWEPDANPRAALGIYLLDVFGNRELIYRDPDIGSTNPTPLAARPAPPVLPSHLTSDAPPTGEVILLDVYRGLDKAPRGSIKKLRIIQIFPKTTPLANQPRMGVAGEENGRAILGTVPVEPDGSARFLVPAGKPILFQALDKDGFAYQTMRSATYLQPGERVSCVGCHESRMTAPPEADAMALHRGPSNIHPGPWGGRPFSFAEMVQPVLDKHCVRCHGTEKTEAKIDLTGVPAGDWTRSYVSLTRDPKLVPRFPMRNQIQVTPPGGAYGALGSRLMKLLQQRHAGIALSPDEMARLAAWIDCNAIFYGTPEAAYHDKQRRGEPAPMPQVQ